MHWFGISGLLLKFFLFDMELSSGEETDSLLRRSDGSNNDKSILWRTTELPRKSMHFTLGIMKITTKKRCQGDQIRSKSDGFKDDPVAHPRKKAYSSLRPTPF